VPEGFDASDVMGMGVAAALAHQYATEQRDFLPLLARVLKDAMPNQVVLVETGFFKKTLKGISVTCGENRMVLEDTGVGPLQASFIRIVRGIALKTEMVSVEEWLTMIGEILEQQASQNQAAHASLAKALGLN
jgi:hypothetical protein